MLSIAEAARICLWAPNPGPQTLLIQCPCFEIFYGGARGGGKTEGSIGDWLIHSAEYGENAVGIFVRRKLTQLTQVISRTKRLFSKIGAKYNEQQKEWTMANGAKLRFVYLERDADAENYQGHEYTRIYIEEATNFPSPEPIHKLKACLRSSAGVPCSMRLTGNPGGPGHYWVHERYVKPGPFAVTVTQEEIELSDGTKKLISIDRTFIPAKLKDNPKLLENDPTYILRLRQSGSAALVKAWLEGLWDAVDGAFFSQWDEAKHVLPINTLIPQAWPRFRAMDWGSARPFSVGWYAVSDGSFLRRGAIVKYNEWYGIKEKIENGKVVFEPNIGLQLHAGTVARGVIARDDITPEYGVADPSIFIQNGGPSIGETMMGAGCSWLRADNSREAGWAELRRLLDPGDGPPLFYVVRGRCQHTIRTISTIQHDEKNFEDVDTKAEDHAVDETRYAVMSRYNIPSAEPNRSAPLVYIPPTINELLARQVARKHASAY